MTRKTPSALVVSNVLCPVTFAGYSTRALRAAAQMARRFDAPLHLLHVVEFVPGLALYSKADVRSHVRDMHEKAAQLLKAEDENAGKGLIVRIAVECGNAAEKILEYIKKNNIALTVIGTHERGYGFMERALLGSTAEKIVRYSPTPVLTVPLEAAAHKKK